MAILNYYLIIVIFLLTPAGVIWLCRRFPLLDKIGPIMILYAVGMIFGNMPFAPEEITPIQEIMPNVLIPLAIPMMLFGCSFSSKDAPLQLKVVSSGFISVVVAVVVGYLLFGCKVKEGAEIGGIITGMYTGGTLNAAALQAIFRINSEQFILINSYDIIISFLYFVFLFGIGIRLFRWLYGEKRFAEKMTQSEAPATKVQPSVVKENPYKKLLSKAGAIQLGKILLTTLAIVAISAGVALLLPEQWFMVVFILLLTTLGVLSSFIRPVRELDVAYDVGMYLIYVFSMVIASMADFSNLDLRGGVYQLAFMTIAVFLSLAIHAILCRLMKVDADSMVISSVAFINSPPFVPMVVAAMNNKRCLVTGLGAGIVGYALGNHLGVLVAELLSRL